MKTPSPRKETPSGLSPLSHTDTAGIEWSFDPSTQRWQAQSGDRKSFSQSYETLSAKVKSWTPDPKAAAKAEAKAVALEPVKVPMIRLELPRGFNRADAFEDLKPTVEFVKVEWSTQEGSARAVRSQPAGDATASWTSHGIQNALFLDPEALDEEALAWWERLYVDRTRLGQFETAARTIAKAWEKTKTANASFMVSRRQVTEPKDGGPVTYTDHWDKVAPVKRDREISWRGLIMPAGVPFFYGAQLLDTAAWKEEGGVWKRGTTTLRLARGKSTSHVFEVCRTVEGRSRPVFESSDWTVALKMANATALTDEAGTEPQEMWRRDAIDWTNEPLESWPHPTTIVAATQVILRQYGREEDSLQLLGIPAEKSAHLDTPTYPAWFTESGGYRSTEKAWYDKGPTDVPALAHMANLRVRVNEIKDSWSDDRIGSATFSETLQAQTAASLRHVYHRAADAEQEEKTPAALLKAWERLVAQWRRRAEARPEVQENAALASSIAEEAVAAMAAAGQGARPSGRRKP